MRALAAGPFLLALLAATNSREELRIHHEKALAAHRQGDFAVFLTESQAVASLAPRSIRALYNVSCAQALLGREEEAVRILGRLVRMGVTFDLAADRDFDRIRASAGFRDAAARMAALDRDPVGSSPVAFTIAEKDLLTEGIAYDPKTRAFFVSSVRKRKIVRVAPDGQASDFVSSGRDGIGSITAIAIDASRRALWASTDVVRQMEGYRKEDEGRSAVLEYDLDTGQLRRSLAKPASVPDAHYSDLTVGPQGEIWVADPYSGRLYVLAAGAPAFRVFLEAGPLQSPQGMAFSPDGRWLFVADYTQGVARVDPRSAEWTLLEAPADAAVTGIDGMVWAGDGLVAIQNGIRPHRVVRLGIDGAAARITEVRVLERGNPHFNEPTLGVVVGSDFYYVANSQYELFGEDGHPKLEALRAPVILRLPVGR